MWLTILKTFLEGREKFHAGERRFVVDEDAALRFLGRHWAARTAAPETQQSAEAGAKSATVDLQPRSTKHVISKAKE